MTGYTNFKDYWRYPDANRTEYSKKGVIINLYVGDQGWTLDKGGVSVLSAASVEDFQDQTKRDINNLLRRRLNEPGMLLRYGGADVVDLRSVDWVDITDSEQRNFRLAVDKSTRLLVRSVVSTADKTMDSRDVETNIYTNFQLMDGVRTALQITTDRNGKRSSQVFFYDLQIQFESGAGPLFQRFSRQTLQGSRQPEVEGRKEERERGRKGRQLVPRVVRSRSILELFRVD